MFEHRLLIHVFFIKIWTYFIINKYIFVPLFSIVTTLLYIPFHFISSLGQCQCFSTQIIL